VFPVKRHHHIAGLIPTVERRRHKNALPFLAPLAALAIPFIGEAVAPALFGAEAAGAGAGLGAGAAEAGGLGADAILAAPATAALSSGVATPLAAGAPALALSDAAISGLPDAVSGLGAGLGAGAGAVTPGVQLASAGISDAGVPGAAGPASLATAPPSAPPVTASPTIGGGTPGAGAAAPAAPAGIAASPSSTGSFLGPEELSSKLLGASNTGIGAGTPTPLNQALLSGGGNVGTPAGTPLTGTNVTPAASSASGGGGGAISSGLNKLLAPTGLTTSDVGPIAAAGGLGLNLLRGNQPLPGEGQIKSGAAGIGSEAASLVAQGGNLQNYLNTGTLPPGVQGGINQASDAAKATVRSQYAARGESGSSAEAQDLAHIDQTASTQGADIAMKLLQTGVGEVAQGISAQGLSSQLYQYLMEQALSRDEKLGSSIANFASSLVPAPTVRLAA
jgi:hypothetical protein